MITVTAQRLVSALQDVYEAEDAKLRDIVSRVEATSSPYDQMCAEQQRYVANLAGKVAARARDMLAQLESKPGD